MKVCGFKNKNSGHTKTASNSGQDKENKSVPTFSQNNKPKNPHSSISQEKSKKSGPLSSFEKSSKSVEPEVTSDSDTFAEPLLNPRKNNVVKKISSDLPQSLVQIESEVPAENPGPELSRNTRGQFKTKTGQVNYYHNFP